MLALGAGPPERGRGPPRGQRRRGGGRQSSSAFTNAPNVNGGTNALFSIFDAFLFRFDLP